MQDKLQLTSNRVGNIIKWGADFMPCNKDLQRFTEKLSHLNTQIAEIENKLSDQTDYLICQQHIKYTKPFFKYQDQLIVLKQKNVRKLSRYKRKKHFSFQDYFLKRA